jgi:urease accessory protein UreF
MQSLLGPRRRPAWFESSIEAVLDRAGVLMAARGPRELEQATAELLGAELHRILGEEREGMWFSWWLEELTEAVAARIRTESCSRDGE